MSMHGKQAPTIGRIIHYVLPDGKNLGEVRAAMVTNVFPGVDEGICNGTVFLDELNDSGSSRYFGSAKYDESTRGDPDIVGVVHYKPGTWHWPPRV